MEKDEVISKLRRWAESNNTVRALVLTSSRSGKSKSPVDQLSDYDVVTYVNSLDYFRNDDWLTFFGDVLVKWPLKPENEFGENWITRLVLFENQTRIDFQITTETNTPPFDYDLGYLVIIDKDEFTQNFPKATNTKHFIKKPTEQEFLEMVNAFFWDAAYVPKYLVRGDLFYVHYMLDVDLRFSHLEKMIEWYIGCQHDWKVNTNVHGKLFPKHLDDNTWNDIEKTFAGANKDEVWKAFYKLVEVFTSFARVVASKCGYQYPDIQEKRVVAYYNKLKAMTNRSET